MAFLDANGVTRLVTDLGSIFEYKISSGAVTSDTSAGTVSLPTMTTGWTNVHTITVPPGSWAYTVTVAFASNSTGIRKICLAATSTGSQTGMNVLQTANAVPDTYTVLQFTFFFAPTENTTFYINAFQNSGSTINCYPRVHRIQIR